MKNGYKPISSGEKEVIPPNMGSHVRNENELHSCKRCPFDNNCEHHQGLYSVDIGHTVVCCNDCGRVLFHGPKKAVELYILQEKEPEFDFGAFSPAPNRRKKMTKDEMKNRISMALKDPVLQQGFEIICKENAEFKKNFATLRNATAKFLVTLAEISEGEWQEIKKDIREAIELYLKEIPE